MRLRLLQHKAHHPLLRWRAQLTPLIVQVLLVEPECRKAAGKMFPSRPQYMPHLLSKSGLKPGCGPDAFAAAAAGALIPAKWPYLAAGLAAAKDSGGAWLAAAALANDLGVFSSELAYRHRREEVLAELTAALSQKFAFNIY